MIEPLLWNPLPAAATWLSQRTGRAFDARSLLDAVISRGKQGDPAPTIIKATLPRELSYTVLTLCGRVKPGYPNSDDVNEVERTLIENLHNTLGPPPNGMVYVRAAYPTVAPLAVNSLLDLLVYGQIDLMYLANTETFNPHEMLWLMPWGTKHRATIDTCGINRADLLALSEILTANTPPQAAPEPTVETKEQRQDNRLRACEAAGLVMPMNSMGRLPDGVGDVADRHGISRQAFSAGVKAALKRREAITKPGRVVRIS